MEIIKRFREAADPRKAREMSAYMKYKFPFLGLPRPVRNGLQKDILKGMTQKASVEWSWVYALYDLPEREFHYAAVDYLRMASGKMERSDLKVIGTLIRRHAWWDTVDALAMVVGTLGERFPEIRSEELQDWAVDPDFWIRRAAILHQLKYKDATDTDFLAFVIRQNTGSKEFFINKAIGWALRQYSKTRPEWVEHFLENESLSSLTRREASRYLALP